MNNRDYKQFAAGEYYHLYNRGNGKMDIFKDPEDYAFLRKRLTEYLQPGPHTMGTIAVGRKDPVQRRKAFPVGAFSLIAFCLMPNHFHLLMRQNADVPLSTLMLNLWTGYSKYFNKKYDRVGTLFQDQFKAVRIDDDVYLTWLSAYIHQNPTVARLTERPEDYPHSSYREYMGLVQNALCDPGIVLDQFTDLAAYEEFVRDGLEDMRTRKEMRAFSIDDI
jgi:REP element-mobilizing transposase RayT